MQSSRFARIGVLLAAVVPPTTVGAAIWEVVRRYPLAFIGGVVAYELLLVVAGVALKVFARLEQRWVDRAADAVDAWSRRLISRYERSYRRYLTAVHRDVDVKGLTTRGSFALSLDDVFVELSLVHQTPHQASADILSADAVNPGTQIESTPQPIWQMLARGEHPLVVLGAPGSGKTTLLKQMTVALCRGGRVTPRRGGKAGSLPVLLFLREHVKRLSQEPNVTLPAVTRDTLKNVDATEPPEWLDRQLRAGRCVVLLDGLDEVARAEDRRLVVDWVERQIAAYPGNRFVLTSRPYGYRAYPLNSADVAQVRAFSERQAKTFVDRWYHATHARATGRVDIGVREAATRMADDLMARLNAHHALHALAVNPLLLTMVAHVHYYRGALPGSRAGLYREICQVLLGRRQEAKGLGGGALTPDQKELVLRVLAQAMMEERARDMTREQASAAIGNALASVKRGVAPEDFLVSIEQECGLLVERENGLYCFAHLTLQEYLAAAYISERATGESLAHRVTDDWWRETTLLYVAQADASPIVRACLKAEPPSVSALELAVDCAEEARELDPSLRDELDGLVSISGVHLPPERLAVTARVMVARKMRRAVRVSEDAWFCHTPVTRAEFALFLAHTVDADAARRYLDGDSTPWHDDGPDAPARGLRSADAIAFVAWCRQFDPSISLPPEGLMRTVPKAVFDTEGQCAWILPPVHDHTAAESEAQLGADPAEYPVLHRFGRPPVVPSLDRRIIGMIDGDQPREPSGHENAAETARNWFQAPDGVSEILRQADVHGARLGRSAYEGYEPYAGLIAVTGVAGIGMADTDYLSGHVNTTDIDTIRFLFTALAAPGGSDLIPIRDKIVAAGFSESIRFFADRIMDDLAGDRALSALPAVRSWIINAIDILTDDDLAHRMEPSSTWVWRRLVHRSHRRARSSSVAYDAAMRRLRGLLYETVKLEMRARGELEPTEVLHLVRS